MGKVASPFLRQDLEALTRRGSERATEQLRQFSECLCREAATSAMVYRLSFETNPGQGLIPLMPPPMIELSSSRSLATTTSEPFLSDSSDGELPMGIPICMRELERYLHLSGKAPEVYMDGRLCHTLGLQEMSAALDTQYAAAEAEPTVGIPSWWCTCEVNGIRHPSWWPQNAASVPGYNSLIVGAGASGIGMHQDCYTNENGQHRLVASYLTVAAGRKHVVMLPPSEEGSRIARSLACPDADHSEAREDRQVAAFPVRPHPDMLDSVLNSGGYWFDIDVAAKSADNAAPSRKAPTSLTLFIPAGWWHWLAGDACCEWHVAWGGSFVPFVGSRS